MQRTLDEATIRFLETGRADLQRHLGNAGTVEAVMIEWLEAEVRLSATVKLGPRRMVFSGTGDNLVAAFGALTRGQAAPRRMHPPQRTKR